MSCTEYTAVPGYYTDPVTDEVTPITVHYGYDGEGNPAVWYTDAAGAIFAAAAAAPADVTLGAPAADGCCKAVNWFAACDDQGAGVFVPFFSRVETTFNPDGTSTDVVTTVAADYVTAYTVTGTAGDCPVCDPLASRGVQATW